MFRKLLVPLDRSPLAEQALAQAESIAKKANAGIDLVLVHQPVTFDGLNDEEWYGQQRNDELQYLGSIAREIESGSGAFVTFLSPEGDVVDEICKRVTEVDADLIVMTSHGRTGLSRMWLGSVADGVIRHAKVPVLMLRPAEKEREAHHGAGVFKHFLVAVDGSELSHEILAPAKALARAENSRITLLRVIPPVPMILPDAGLIASYSPSLADTGATEAVVEQAKQELSAVRRRIAEEGFEVDAHILVNVHIAGAILDYAEKNGVDVIALSTHGRGVSRFVLGSVADKVVRGCTIPVLVQRPVGARNAKRFSADETYVAMSPSAAHM